LQRFWHESFIQLLKTMKFTFYRTLQSTFDRHLTKATIVSLSAGVAALLLASGGPASGDDSVQLSDARVVRTLGGGSYVTGVVEPSFGYAAPDAVNVHVAAYDARGKLLAEKVDTVDADELTRWHLDPNPRASYTVFFPWAPSQIASVNAWTE
jgi:hypothetical protein